jgi:hypothetical protein
LRVAGVETVADLGLAPLGEVFDAVPEQPSDLVERVVLIPRRPRASCCRLSARAVTKKSKVTLKSRSRSPGEPDAIPRVPRGRELISISPTYPVGDKPGNRPTDVGRDEHGMNKRPN